MSALVRCVFARGSTIILNEHPELAGAIIGAPFQFTQAFEEQAIVHGECDNDTDLFTEAQQFSQSIDWIWSGVEVS